VLVHTPPHPPAARPRAESLLDLATRLAALAGAVLPPPPPELP
jgi:hypothetical protein